ncbi:integrator complex subunit 10-like [Oppia nitens]|uniref:integrator complex subunit 10-like n=1 Tax=Oppia nitens TaxID=1686743 RepID=UPI0023D9A4D4|nr:integrator complex subunit 10-like [Oppia nitens]
MVKKTTTGTVAADDGDHHIRQYMISRAKSCLAAGDASYGKCWIMTANALFPHNDNIKLESYEICKCEDNVEEAVKYLCDMFDGNQCSDQLMIEMNKLVISCRNEWQTYHLSEQRMQSVFGIQWSAATTSLTTNELQFYGKLFACLSREYQYKMLRRVVDRIDDKVVSIDLLLFILKRFPDSVPEIGVKLIDIIDENDELSGDSVDQQLNEYFQRKLVFDVLPIIFVQNNDSSLALDSQKVQKLIQKGFKFFVRKLIVRQSDGYSQRLDKLDSNQDSDGGNKENSDVLEAKIVEIMHLIGLKNDWKLFENIDFLHEKQLDLIYDKISRFIDEFRFRGDTDTPMDLSSASTAMISGDEQTEQQILYATLLLFLECLYKYLKISSNVVLIEELGHSLAMETKMALSMNKKRKLTAEPLLMTGNIQMKNIFVVASKALKLLQENLTISSEYLKLSELIGLKSCESYQSFVIDSNIYRGEYSEVFSLIANRKSNTIKNSLQLISVSLMIHDYNSTLKYCLEAIECLPLKSPSSTVCDSVITVKEDVNCLSKTSQLMDSSSRQLVFIQLSIDEIMNYLIEVIIQCLKDRILLSLKPSDIGLGHLIVLCQYKWPNNLQLFLACISCVRNAATNGGNNGSQSSSSASQPKFIYPYFFNYIFIPDIIEEFMNLVEKKVILLELKPSPSAALGAQLKTSSKVMTTRGVNKGFIEENRSSLIQQMKVSKTMISNELFIDFINKEIL